VSRAALRKPRYRYGLQHRDAMGIAALHPSYGLPDGQISAWPVQSRPQKYSCSRQTQITFITLAVPAHRGAFRDRHGRWAGDAVDANGAEDEGADLRTAKSCGPDASTPASSRRKQVSADDGDKQARSPGRARRKPLKPLRGECRAFSGVTVVTNARAYYQYTRGCGRIGRPAFPAPSEWRERYFPANLARNMRRDREIVSLTVAV
jgi:hypothetical protein